MERLLLFPIVILGLILSFGVIAQAQSLFDLENLQNQNLADITAYNKIKIIDTWNFLEQKSQTTTPVNIGIFDTGIDISHPEFNNVRIAATLIRDTEPSGRGHGTQVTGIIGANNVSFDGSYIPPQMNGILPGVRGIDYTLQIRSIPEFTSSTDNFQHFVVLDRLSRSPGGLQVVNSSWGHSLCSELSLPLKILLFFDCVSQNQFDIWKGIYTDLVNQYASTTFVFSAGNEGIDVQFHLPGGGVNTSNTIAVGATDLNDNRADPITPIIITLGLLESNFGSSVDVSAPGVQIYAPRPPRFLESEGQYTSDFGGTSGATPMVTGVAAILKALEPEYQKYTPGLLMTPEKIKEILVASADPVSTDELLGQGCFNQTTESGCRLNSHRAVAWQFPPASSTLSISTTTADSIDLSWTLNNFDFKNPDFDSYRLFRSISSPATQSSTLVFSDDASSTLSFTDEGLSPNTTFFYKLFTFDQAGLSSESNEVSAATQAPTIPDIRGLYSGSATSAQTNCQNPADNITVSWPSISVNVSDQTNGNFNATGTTTVIVNSDVFLDNFVIAGSVSESGNLSGTVANTFFINDIFNSGGQGTFTGQFLNDILNLSFSTQDIVGDTCSVQGTLTAARQ